MKAPFKGGILALVWPILIQGCVENPEITSLEGDVSVTLGLDGLQPLPGDLNYQAWLIMGAPPDTWGHPLVVFDMNEDGEMVHPVTDSVFSGVFRTDVNLDEVSGIGISIEKSADLLTYSSYTFVLGGNFSGGEAQLSSDHWIALNRSYAETEGRFVLATPTDADPDNELAGLWFMDPTSSPTAPGLVVPEAPQGWNYESWIELGGATLSLGKFLNPSAPDSANFYSGTVGGPGFPGEDFLTEAPSGLSFPPDLAGSVVFVTLEPQGDLDVEPDLPFFFRFLEATIPAEPAASTLYEMSATGAFLPTGTVTIEEIQ